KIKSFAALGKVPISNELPYTCFSMTVTARVSFFMSVRRRRTALPPLRGGAAF
ncbi:MAG: hypothetical protein ACI9FJ_002854, partial [Alteromonadaceae bacterium]